MVRLREITSRNRTTDTTKLTWEEYQRIKDIKVELKGRRSQLSRIDLII